jgi:glycosyltransferase involved in cell wall biosynthesis
VLHQENGGQSSARNFGASHAAGDWLAFLDQDDRWKDHRLATVVQHLNGRADLVYTDADTIDQYGHPREQAIHRTLGLGCGHPPLDAAATLFRDVFVMPGVMTIRTEFYRSLGGFDPTLSGYEDDDLFVRAVHRGRVAYVPESTLEWRTEHGGNSSLTHRMVDSRVRYWRKLVRDFARDGADRPLTRRITTRFFLECLRQATMCLDRGDPLAAANVAAADGMASGLGPVDRLAYTTTRWAWRRSDRQAYLTRWWLLNGLQRTAEGL